jgi:superfamily II DNA/RNA helicase
MEIAGIPQHPVATTDKSFEDLGLSPEILSSLKRIGFEHPTPIQARVIPVALTGRDVIGLAQTGSGKTAAFVLPIAQRLDHGKGVRSLILSPTREIALQTKAFLDLFGQTHDLETACLIGGVKMKPQIDALRGKPDIVVATPGRLMDHVNRGNV